MKVAFLHDWLDSYRGGEKVLEALLSLYPDAPIYTLFYKPDDLPESITSRRVYAPWWLKPFHGMRKLLLPILPWCLYAFRVNQYDLLISTSSCVIKGVPNRTKHISYIHSPMRYIYDEKHNYFGRYLKIPVLKQIVQLMIVYLRWWDRNSNSGIDQIVVNSTFLRERVQRSFGRDAEVIHPPIVSPEQCPHPEKKDHFVVAGALIPYKRTDLAIKACERLGLPLKILGEGPERKRLEAIGYGEFLGRAGAKVWHETISTARGLIFPGVEDFGMVPVEAMAMGTAVIALQKGGALDYIAPRETGVFFDKQNVASLVEALCQL